MICLLGVLLVLGGGALAEGVGLLIYKRRSTTPDSFAFAVEFASIESFPTIHNFITAAGEKRSVSPESVEAILHYRRLGAATIPDVMDARDMAAIQGAVDRLDALSRRFPAAQRYLAPFIGELQEEQARFRRGQGKFAGSWFPSLAAAQQARDAPLRQAGEARARQQAFEQENLRRAQEEERRRLAELAKEERRRLAELAMDERGRLADLAKVEAEETAMARAFFDSAAALVKQAAALEIWGTPVEDLAKVPPLPKELANGANEASRQYAALERELTLPAARQVYAQASAGLEVLLAWSSAAGAFGRLNAPEGAAVLRTYLDAHPRAETEELAPIWGQIQKLDRLSRDKAQEAERRLQRAKKLAADGKNAQAIVEFQAAHSLFPDPGIPAQISTLRKESLGL